MSLRFGVLVLLGCFCLSRLEYAQSQGCVDSTTPSHDSPQKTRISIVGVEFQSEAPLSQALRAQLAEDIRHSESWATPEEPDSSWVNQAIEPVRDALRSQGYFKNDVEGTPYLTLALANERRYILSVAIGSGPQYKLGNLQFASASDAPLLFTDALLRQQFHLQEGDLFDGTKIREGLEAIGRLYGSKGYIDATPEPEMTIDEKNLRIDLLIKVDEQESYRIAKIEFLSRDTKAQNKPTFPQERGDVFNMSRWRSFFEENKSHLPEDAALNRNMRVRRNASDATVEITLDFRPCPKTQQPED
jgi:outer membrane protein assembly factor BamA